MWAQRPWLTSAPFTHFSAPARLADPATPARPRSHGERLFGLHQRMDGQHGHHDLSVGRRLGETIVSHWLDDVLFSVAIAVCVGIGKLMYVRARAAEADSVANLEDRHGRNKINALHLPRRPADRFDDLRRLRQCDSLGPRPDVGRGGGGLDQVAGIRGQRRISPGDRDGRCGSRQRSTSGRGGGRRAAVRAACAGGAGQRDDERSCAPSGWRIECQRKRPMRADGPAGREPGRAKSPGRAGSQGLGPHPSVIDWRRGRRWPDSTCNDLSRASHAWVHVVP